MISRIIKKTQGKSSPNGKTPVGFYNQTQKPSPFIEQPHRVTIPLEIRTYRRVPKTTVQILENPRQWMYGKPEPTILPTGRKCNMKVCQWYRRKRAIKQLARYHKNERKRALQERLEQEKRDIEQKAFEHFKMQEIRKQYKVPCSSSHEIVPLKKTLMDRYHEGEKEKVRKKSLDKERKELEHQAMKHFKAQQEYPMIPFKEDKRAKRNLEREKKALEKQALEHFKLQESYKPKKIKTKKLKIAKKSYAKPKTASKAVAEKRLSRYDDIGVRFTNCFYRICCQLYCCFTCFVIIGFVVFIIL